MANTLAYYKTETITAVKCFMVQAPEGEKKAQRIGFQLKKQYYNLTMTMNPKPLDAEASVLPLCYHFMTTILDRLSIFTSIPTSILHSQLMRLRFSFN